MKHIAWFSAGVSSAVATKLVLNEIDEIVYTHIEDQHPDTLRFLHDCEGWYGRGITMLQSPLGSVENACFAAGGRGYVNGPGGAPCTMRLKRRVRKEYERQQTQPLVYYWGMDASPKEIARASRLREDMPQFEHRFPLIEQGITKRSAHAMLLTAGIDRPKMYELGYGNNNCIGCVKGGMGYWNKIRQDFPEVFAARAAMERIIGGTCIKGVYLDELEPTRGRKELPIVADCDSFCDTMAGEGGMQNDQL